MTTLSCDLVIYSNDEDWAERMKGSLRSVLGVRDCRAALWPSDGVIDLTLSSCPTLHFLDARDNESAALRSWPETVLDQMNCILIVPRAARPEWNDCLAKYDWDALDEEDCNLSLLTHSVHSRLRILHLGQQVEDLSRQLDASGNWAMREWIQDREAIARVRSGQAEFLASMSHEIRTPLNTIIGMSDLLMESHIHGVEKKHLDVIKKSSQSLLALVENILDLARLESGRVSYEQSVFDIHELMEQCFDVVSPRAHKKGLETTLDLDRNLPVLIETDRNRLNQILVNLLSNAANYTETGHILLKGWLETPSRLCVDVEDSGPGLSAEQLTRLWEMPQVGEPNLLRTQSGPGLGLVLARKFIEGLGGSLEVETQPGQGTRIHIQIPVQVISSASVDGALRSELKPIQGLQALILDHHPESLQVTSKYLRELGMRVETSSTSAEFLARLMHFDPSYDVALIDYETAGPQLSTWFSQAGSVPRELRVAILLKSNTHAWSRIPRRKSTLGLHHLLKPVKRGELATLLKTMFRESFPENAKEDSIELLPRARADESFRILVVDDSKENRYLMQAYLRNAFHATWFAEDGRMAVEMARSRRYDLIFMDLQMPEMDGITAIQHIRQHELQNGWPRTPIYALTAHVQAEERKRALDAGCDDYIVKPVTKATILESIQRARGPQWVEPSQTQLNL